MCMVTEDGGNRMSVIRNGLQVGDPKLTGTDKGTCRIVSYKGLFTIWILTLQDFFFDNFARFFILIFFYKKSFWIIKDLRVVKKKKKKEDFLVKTNNVPQLHYYFFNLKAFKFFKVGSEFYVKKSEAQNDGRREWHSKQTALSNQCTRVKVPVK